MTSLGHIPNKITALIAVLLLPLVALIVVKEWWPLLLIPGGLIVFWVTLYRLDWAMWFIVAATPVSVNLTDLTGGTGLSLPTEPMLVLVTALVLLKMLIFGEYDKRLIGPHFHCYLCVHELDAFHSHHLSDASGFAEAVDYSFVVYCAVLLCLRAFISQES